MGTWGVHSFENDVAQEWAAAYREMGLSVAKSTIEIALADHANNALTADLSCRAVAAVEAVACALGRGSPEAHKEFSGAPEADATLAEALISEGDALISAVTDGSELNVLWREAGAGEYENWVSSLTELRARLNGAPSAPAPEASAETVEAAVNLPTDSSLDDLRKAISELSADMQVMRKEMSDNFRRLAKRIEARDR